MEDLPVLPHSLQHQGDVRPERLVHEPRVHRILLDSARRNVWLRPDELAVLPRHLLEHRVTLLHSRKHDRELLPDVRVDPQHQLPVSLHGGQHDLWVCQEIWWLIVRLVLVLRDVQLRVQRDRQVQRPPVLFAGLGHDFSVPREGQGHESHAAPVVPHHVHEQAVAHLRVPHQRGDEGLILQEVLGHVAHATLVVLDEIKHGGLVREQALGAEGHGGEVLLHPRHDHVVHPPDPL
mmetsp:Transcript_70603/g.206667  ORF Transcript_70603/g.206667 Transcript_70603/m.206667 type:complete len:235 (+) Transcript_70603:793-1497(+)